ncbi:MAG: right-handed parallel beta-helix repeat-containing protein [Bacteroidales bacterium]|nr:right-handed parallel beta-helix repeat-containing protein [Bacteroidales bacterium]
MKKILLFATTLAALFLSASCQRENLEPVAAGATFTVTVPGETATKAFSDGTNINKVLYEIYKTDEVETATAQPLAKGAVSMSNKEATVTFDLLQDQEYTVIFWAQKSVNEEGTNKYYNTGDLRTVSINAATALNANDEDRAAFFKRVDFATPMAEVKEVELVRPFAQLNLGTTATSLNPVQPGQTQGYTINVEKSYVKVEGLSTTFNTLTGVAAEEDNDFEFALYETPYAQDNTEVLEVNGVKYHYVGMNYFFVSKNEDLVTVSYKIKTDKGEITNENIINVPVKANYRTNIIGNLLTTEADFEIVVDEDFNIPDELVGEGVVFVKTSEELLAALQRNESHIVIDLVGTQTKAVTPVEFKIPVGAHEPKYYFGGEKTKTITINANGNTINFDHKNTDWNYIRCVNDAAKWIINDAVLTNSGANDGPWNRHDISFYNAVELNNVVSDKAFALFQNANLTNVQISDVHPNNSEAYGIWIRPNGQTVNLDGVTITPSENKTTDRAIKIDDQYVDNPAKVVLNVANSKFVSQKKSAILVKSPAGAEINWGEGNDITGVTADPINAVWVDEASAQYASEVNVKGASKVVEGAVENVPASDQAALTAALEEAAKNPETTVVVNVAADTYGTLPALSSNVVLNCAEGTVFEGTSGLNVNGATVIGATFESDGTAVSGTIDGVFKNCTFDGSEALRWCYTDEGDEILFEDCVIKTDFRGFHFDGMNGNVTFRRCEINGFNAYGGKGTATFENCVFGNDESGYNGLNTYSNTVLKDCKFVYNSGKTNFIDMEGTGKTLSITNCTATLDGTETPVIDFVGGSKLDNNTVILDGKTYASSQTSLSNALNNGATEVLLKDGNYTMPEPDLRGKGLTVTGSKDVVIDAQAVDARDQFVTGATLKFEGVTLNFGIVNYMGFANTASLTYKDCDINGLQFLFGQNVVFDGCSLNSNGAEHTVWTYGVKNVSFTGCDFTYGDRGVNCYSDNDVAGGQTVNFTKCTFATENTASEGAVEINSCFISEGIVVNMDGCTAPAYGKMAYVSPWDSTNGAKTTINIK